MHLPSFPPPTAKEVVTAPRTLKTAPRALIKNGKFSRCSSKQHLLKKATFEIYSLAFKRLCLGELQISVSRFYTFFFIAGVRVNHHDSDLYSGYARTRKNLAKTICLQSYYIAHFLKFSFSSCMEELELIFFGNYAICITNLFK